ncbi:translation initiation factor eIF-2B subunit epsilon-like [Dendronephthya gigantea]|uniref:translation initiation factor eIF-2B subunit epsilon-like n=1 Tax=Dendronephthya gigantea TaxID=151771 RepID=UPI00106C38F7|nr:translation initiation factor eIF-2B subunit epsilon-like [Dendronephthya gigantea]
MPSKKKESKSGQQSASWEKPDDVLQAVILADSFNFRFLPITLEKPRALLPLVNYTLLDYTVDFLIGSGIKEIFVFCSSHAKQIINFIKDPEWVAKHSTCTFHTILSEGCMSMGDALREIDRQAFIKTDFILVNGDLVSNIKLDKVLKEHKERRQKSKSSIMTMIYKQAAPDHKTRSLEDDVFLAIESTSNRILHWEKTRKKNKFSLPLELFIENKDVKLRYDLLDCGISICSTEVPQLFTDNFDYQTKDDFVRGIIINEEVMGNKIHSYVVDVEYGARVTNIQMYDSISKDIIRRWAYPVVPDNSILHSNNTYMYNRHNVYFGTGVIFARDCILEQDVVVGSGSSVGTGSVIRNSVIGKQCVIGDNVVIEDSYIWDGVKIENNCRISKSILCDNVVVKQNVTTQKGCVLSFNVVVGPDINLSSGIKITLKIDENKDDFGMEKLSLEEKPNAESYNPEDVGSDGRGYVWKKEIDSDGEDEQELIDLWGRSSENISNESESSDDSFSAESPTASPPPEDSKLFYNEVLDTVRNGIANKVNPDNLVLEINASKYAYNVTFHELNHAVTKTFLECLLSDYTTYQQDVLKDIKKAVVHFHPVFSHYMKESENQRIGIQAAEEFFIQNEEMSPAFQSFLHLMYDREVFDENVILDWFKSPVDDSIGNENPKKIRDQVSRFIKWLEEAEEESDD